MEGKSPYKNVLSQVHPEKCADGYSDVIQVYIGRQDIRNIMLAVRSSIYNILLTSITHQVLDGVQAHIRKQGDLHGYSQDKHR